MTDAILEEQAENFDVVVEEKEEKKKDKEDFHTKDRKKISILEEKIKELEALVLKKDEIVNQEKDKTLRSYAELENFKKRKEQEKQDFCKFANEQFIREILPVLDSFDLAIEHAKNDKEKKKEILHGFEMIQKQFLAAIEKMGVIQIEALNKEFDPNFHQAVLQEQKEGYAENTILKVMQKGYLLNERLLRPAMVVVAK